MRNKILSLLLIIAGMVCANSAQAVTPTQAIVNLVKAEVAQTQYQLPMATGGGFQLTKVWYIPASYTVAYKFVYDHPVMAKPTNAAISELKKGVIHMLKANPDSKDMTYLKSGITFHYNYYNPDGSFLCAMKITPADVK